MKTSRWLVLALCWGAVAQATIPQAPRAEVMRNPAYLPETLREMLRRRMQQHGDDMSLLMATVLMLNYGAAEEVAKDIANEPKLGRPGPQDKDTLNARLPPRFFELQDQLEVRARAVAAAAKSLDDARMAKAYGRLAETCVACHSTYLRGAETAPDEE